MSGIQKTSTIYNYNNKLDNSPSVHNTLKKLKHFHHPSLIQSLIDNSNILKIAHHNVISFVNSTKQNQIIQEVFLNNIDILGLSETNLPYKDAKFQKFYFPEDYVYFFESTKLHKGSSVDLCIKKALSNHIFYHY